MLTAVAGHYDGTAIVMDEAIPMDAGQQVVITILGVASKNKAKLPVNLDKYMGRGRKMFYGDAAEYVKELRENDRM